DRLSIPVLANGDIVDVASAFGTLEATGAAGLMIGRGAIRDPWVFRRIERAMAGGPPLVVDLDEMERVLLGYYRALRPDFRDDRGALGRMKKIARYFTEGVPGGDELRRGIFHATGVDEVFDRIRRHFDGLREAGAAGPLGGPEALRAAS